MEEDITQQRVKVYELNSEGHWDDRGTGQCVLKWMEEKQGSFLVVHSEDDGSLLLESKIMPNETYQQQQATLIVWTEEDGTDRALSFQQARGCEQIYEDIMLLQRGSKDAETFYEEEEEEEEEEEGEENDDEDPDEEDPHEGNNNEDGDEDDWEDENEGKYMSELQANDQADDEGRELLRKEPKRIKGAKLKKKNKKRKGIDYAVIETNAGPHVSHHRLDEFALDFNDNTPLNLPSVQLGHLEEIEKTMEEASSSMYKRDKLVTSLLNGDYMKALLGLFDVIEDVEDETSLMCLYRIFKMIIFLNDCSLLEKLVEEETVERFFGVMEYDPKSKEKSARHRDYLKNAGEFKQVIEMKNENAKSKIRQTHRIQYLKDVILAREIDDATFSTLNSMIFFNQAEIIDHLQNDEAFLNQLFKTFEDTSISGDRLKEIILFILEFCTIAKNMQISSRTAFYQILCQHGLLSIMEHMIEHESSSIRSGAADILTNMVDHDASLLRNFIIAQQTSAQTTLLSTIIGSFIQTEDLGVQFRLSEVIRILVDPLLMDATNATEKDDFLNLFYDKYIQKLVEPLMHLHLSEAKHSEPGLPSLQFTKPKASLLNHIVELLSGFVHQHTYRIKFFILGHTVAQKISLLLFSQEKYLILSALRFFRTFIGLKDEFYNRYFSKNKFFGNIIQAFHANCHRNNLVSSALLELFEFLRRENVKNLIAHLMEHYADDFKDVDYVDTFGGLRLRHEQNQEAIKTDASQDTSKDSIDKEGVDGDLSNRGLDENEEAYFERSDEEVSPSYDECSEQQPSSQSIDLDISDSNNEVLSPSSVSIQFYNESSSDSDEEERFDRMFREAKRLRRSSDDDDDDALPLKGSKLSKSPTNNRLVRS